MYNILFYLWENIIQIIYNEKLYCKKGLEPE